VPLSLDPVEPLEEFDPPPQPLISDAESNKIPPQAVANDRENRRGRGMPANKPMTLAAASNAPRIQRILRDQSRSLEPPIGKSPDLAVVVTETVAVAAVLPLTITLDGDTEQAGPAGATLQVSATVPVKPPVPANESGYVAVLPAVTVAVPPPDPDPTEKSGGETGGGGGVTAA
jgi:hypothetical protein